MPNRLAAERALILAPHPDDGELGCGGTISRFLEEGVDVYTIVFSRCLASLPEGSRADTRADEARAAIGRLGMEPDHLHVLDYPVRHFDQCRQEILDELIRFKNDIDPDVVFLPCPQDMHQDHVVIATEGIRACKHSTVLAYELPWNNLTFATSCFIALGPRHLERKLDAMSCYVSQQHRPYADPDFIRGLARTRGVESGHTFAEAFQTIRLTISHATAPQRRAATPCTSGQGVRVRPRRRIPPAFSPLSELSILP